MFGSHVILARLKHFATIVRVKSFQRNDYMSFACCFDKTVVAKDVLFYPKGLGCNTLHAKFSNVTILENTSMYRYRKVFF